MLSAKIRDDLTKAIKAKDSPRTAVLRLLMAEIINKKIEKQAEPTDEEIIAIIRRGIKQRQEAAALYRQGKRDDLYAKETAEIDILNTYLPQQADLSEIEKIVRETICQMNASGPADFGKVMGATMGQLKGKADGQTVAKIVREILS